MKEKMRKRSKKETACQGLDPHCWVQFSPSLTAPLITLRKAIGPCLSLLLLKKYLCFWLFQILFAACGI